MNNLQLILTSKSAPSSLTSSNLVDWTSDELWRLVHDHSMHLFLREPMLLELARRADQSVINFCRRLIMDPNVECWFLALKVLVTLGSPLAFEILLDEYVTSSERDRRNVASLLAQLIDEGTASLFKRVVREFVGVGRLDVTGWTSNALDVLHALCKRHGILTKLESSLPYLRRSESNLRLSPYPILSV